MKGKTLLLSDKINTQLEHIVQRDTKATGQVPNASRLVSLYFKSFPQAGRIKTLVRDWHARHGNVAKFKRQEKPPHFQTIGVPRLGTWFIDYADFMPTLKGYNDRYNGFLLAVEHTTQKLFVFPVRNKSAISWALALRFLVGDPNNVVSLLISDRDSVATSAKFIREMRTKYHVRWFHLVKLSKSWLAEIHIRYMKRKLAQTMQQLNTKRWIDLVPQIVQHHNFKPIGRTKYHRSSVTNANFQDFMAQLTGKPHPDLLYASYRLPPFSNATWNKRLFKFAIGDKVHVSFKADWRHATTESHSAFAKPSVKGSFSPKIYTISGRELRKTSAISSGGVRKAPQRLVAGKYYCPLAYFKSL